MKGVNKKTGKTERNQGITDRHFRTDVTLQVCIKKYFKKQTTTRTERT